MDLHIAGKVAVVTGASRGIGKAVARELAREGAAVAAVALDPQRLAAAADALTRDTQGDVRPFPCDVADDAAVATTVTAIAAAFRRIDILVNCAVQRGRGALLEIDRDAFFGDMDIKLLGALRLARDCAPHMARQGGGRIVNFGGLAARMTSGAGSATNIGVVAMTKNLAQKLAPQHITTVCVHPGFTRTERTPSQFERDAKARGVGVDQIEREWNARNLLGVMVTAEQVAQLVAFLASPRSTAINGEAIAVGGGAAGVIYY